MTMVNHYRYNFKQKQISCVRDHHKFVCKRKLFPSCLVAGCSDQIILRTNILFNNLFVLLLLPIAN